VGLYGRGFDFPAIDLIIFARATQSTALWVQSCLRGTRIAPDKTDCLVLDFAGNIRRIGPVNSPIIPAPRRKGDAVKGEAPVKICPQCFSYLHTRTMVCPDCGYVFPPPSSIKKTADTADILRKTSPLGAVVEEHEVLGVRYKPSMSKNGNYMLRVTYSTFAYRFHEYKFFDANNLYTQQRNKEWWIHRGGNLPIPIGTDEASDRAINELQIPKLVRVDVSEKYPRVLGVEFDEVDAPF
jgi:DNA repair protein RadD